MLLLLSHLAVAADCPATATATAMADEAKAVRSALEAGDPQRFQDALHRLERTVDCLGELPPLPDMAEYRMYRGVHAFGRGDLDLAAGEFLAARALRPDLVLPVYPADHAINGVARRHDPIRAERERLPAPKQGDLYVDGYATRERYLAAPALVQRVHDGAVETIALGPGEAPSYATRHPVRTGLTWTAIGLSGLGAGLIAASTGPRGAFLDGDASTVGELNRLRAQTNGLAGGGLGCVTLGLAAGAGAVIWRDR
jgi:hypothetical protein